MKEIPLLGKLLDSKVLIELSHFDVTFELYFICLGQDPVGDLKSSGILALLSIAYMGSRYAERTQVHSVQFNMDIYTKRTFIS
jgi:hypothetical protein